MHWSHMIWFWVIYDIRRHKLMRRWTMPIERKKQFAAGIGKHSLKGQNRRIALIFVTWLWLSQAAEVLSSVLRRELFVASVWAMHCLFCERGWTAIWTVICLIDSAVYFLLWKEMDSKSSLLFQCPVPNSQIFCLGRRHKFLLLWAHFFFQDQELRTRRIRTNIGSGSRLSNSV